jgi:formylglycine-generating enzyme required for sulfatase activity
MNGNTGNTNPPSAGPDDPTQTATNDPTQANRALTGTGPRTTGYDATKTGRSWYSPGGLADPVGNVWEWVATFFGGLKTATPGTAVNWDTVGGGGYEEGDQAYNFQGQAYNPDTGGWTEGLPSMLIVGGSWGDGAGAGVRAAGVYYSAGNAYAGIGFRSAR